MTLWSRIRSWLRAVVRRSRTENEMDVELRFHIEAFAEDLVRSGVSHEQALRRGRIEFGGVERAKEECRQARGVNFIHSILQDLRYGLRMLGKNPGLTFLAVLTTSLGIAANVAVFSIVDALFLSSVPAKTPERLVRILAPENDGEGYFSFAEIRLFAGAIENGRGPDCALFDCSSLHFGQWRNRRSARRCRFEQQLPYAGIAALSRPLFTGQEDSVADHEAVAVPGYGLWQRIYSGKSNVLGKTFLINGRTFRIVGIMPPDFHGVEIGGTP